VGLLAGTRLLALDTETTGMSPEDGSTLVEAASVTLENGEIGATWSSLVRPGRPIPPDAVRVHGITDAMVADAPEPAAIAGRLRVACGDLPLVFHNAPFDLPFLVDLMRASGQPPLHNPIVDTLGLARGLFEGAGNSLAALAARFGLPAPSAHRALSDALTTAHLFRLLARRWEEERGIRSLPELAAQSQDVLRLTARR
jgi:DNA polymerase III epsilon subunit family exonuclease